MKISEIQELPPAEIRSQVEKLRQSVWKMRFQAKGEPMESPGALRQMKRDVARMLTVLRAKELAAGRDGHETGRGTRNTRTKKSVVSAGSTVTDSTQNDSASGE
jgi:large subunit ribosomal protein L29